MTARAHFTVGAALTRAVRVVAAAPVAFLVFAVVAALPLYPIFLDILRDDHVAAKALTAVIPLASLLTGSVAAAAGMHAAATQLRGDPVRLGPSLAIGIRSFPPMLGLALLQTLGLGALGALALIDPVLGGAAVIVGGTPLLLLVGLACPIAVVDRVGVVASIQRAARLSKGSRLRLLALALVFGALLVGVPFTVGFVVATVAAMAGFDTGALGGPLGALMSAVMLLLGGALGPALLATVHHALRDDPMGVPTHELADVFA